MFLLQFIERFKVLNNQVALSSTVNTTSLLKKMSRVGRLVSRELDTDSEAEEDGNLDPSKPWLAEYDRYMNTHESIPSDMTTVQWWGVCKIFKSFRKFVHNIVLPA
jgi:hypothetical protein